MKRPSVNDFAATPGPNPTESLPPTNGNSNSSGDTPDFTVRLPGTWVGLAGKVADTFNEIVAANQHMAQELKRLGHVVGKQGMTRERTRFHESRGAWGEMETSVNTLVEDLLRPTNEMT